MAFRMALAISAVACAFASASSLPDSGALFAAAYSDGSSCDVFNLADWASDDDSHSG
jgi:hypothetical protein